MSPHEPLPEPDDQRQLALPEPLCSLVRRCATFCEPECCGVNAFDVNVYVMLTWVKNAGDYAASQASNQLTALIDSVSAHQGPVVSDDDFGTTWTGGSECAAYLRTWLHELWRARSLVVQGTPSAEQRLAEARQDSHRAYYLEVRRLTSEAGGLFRTDRAVGLRMFGLIAGLDENDVAISSAVLYSREVLRTNDLYWNVDPKTRAHMIAVCVHRLCRMPIAFQERGNISMVQLIRETDYSALADDITESVLEEYLHRHAELVPVWVKYAEDQRCTPAFRVSAPNTGGDPPNEWRVLYWDHDAAERWDRAFTDQFTACAFFIKRHAERLISISEGR